MNGPPKDAVVVLSQLLLDAFDDEARPKWPAHAAATLVRTRKVSSRAAAAASSSASFSARSCANGATRSAQSVACRLYPTPSLASRSGRTAAASCPSAAHTTAPAPRRIAPAWRNRHGMAAGLLPPRRSGRLGARTAAAARAAAAPASQPPSSSTWAPTLSSQRRYSALAAGLLPPRRSDRLGARSAAAARAAAARASQPPRRAPRRQRCRPSDDTAAGVHEASA